MLSDPVAEAFGLIHRHPSGENFWYGIVLLLKLRLYDANRLRFCSDWLIYTRWLSNSHSNIASMQKNRGDKSHRVFDSHNAHNAPDIHFASDLY